MNQAVSFDHCVKIWDNWGPIPSENCGCFIYNMGLEPFRNFSGDEKNWKLLFSQKKIEIIGDCKHSTDRNILQANLWNNPDLH